MFQEKDYEWLQVINCLKRTGMPLKDIRAFIDMAMEGDRTIEPRLAIIQCQLEAVQEQMAEFQRIMDTLEFKCCYYETAKEAGITAVPRNMPVEEMPEQYREAAHTLRDLPKLN